MNKKEEVYKISFDITMKIIKESPLEDDSRKANKIINKLDIEEPSEQTAKAITIPELAELLKIGINKAYELVNTGEIKSIKIGKQIRIPIQSVDKYLDQ